MSLYFPTYICVRKLPNRRDGLDDAEETRAELSWEEGFQTFRRTVPLREVPHILESILQQGIDSSNTCARPN